MNIKSTILAICLFFVSKCFGKFNDRIYQGIDPLWVSCKSVESRLNLISNYLSETPTVFEVGAFDGSDTLKLASNWPNGKIISFEANPKRFDQYKEKTSKLTNTLGFNLAVNTFNGESNFFLCWGTNGENPIFEGASSVLPASAAMEIHYMGPTIKVPCVVLDDWCRINEIPKFDFMWLDLEGFELPFLKSSPQILKNTKVIYTETNFFEFRQGTTLFPDLLEFLTKQGFSLIAHWYNEGLQGDAIFVRNEIMNSK